MQCVLAEIVTWEGVARAYWPVVALALAISLIATPLCRRYAIRHKIVDKPDDFLKPHGRPIPYLGGVAIFLGWFGGLLVAFLLPGVKIDPLLLAGIAVAGAAIMFVGLFDDLHFMSPRVKLAANVAVAMLLVCLGIGDDLARIGTDLAGLTIGPGQEWLLWVYSVPVTLFIVVGTCNATNLIDGMDGLCSGVLGIIALGYVILAAHLRLIYPEREFCDERLVLALAMAGAAAGFLPYNRNPAKIFMGDAGSMLLGLNAAVLILLFAEAKLVRWMVGALMVMALPIGDMLLAMARRWRNGRPLMIGDRSHFYDQLRDKGYSVGRVVAISYLLSLAFALAGVSVIYLRTRYVFILYFLVCLAIVLAVWRLDMTSIEPDEKRRRAASSAGKE